jgi:hypothetical protein
MNEQLIQAQLETMQRINDTAKRWIWVTFQKEGIHCYPAALKDTALEDVKFLGHPHRHTFHFKVEIQVVHNDRDIEFIQFKRWLESLYTGGILELDYQSCEMMCDNLYLQIAEKYSDRDVHITISEDNENGATIEYNTTQPMQSLKI